MLTGNPGFNLNYNIKTSLLFFKPMSLTFFQLVRISKFFFCFSEQHSPIVTRHKLDPTHITNTVQVQAVSVQSACFLSLCSLFPMWCQTRIICDWPNQPRLRAPPSDTGPSMCPHLLPPDLKRVIQWSHLHLASLLCLRQQPTDIPELPYTRKVPENKFGK